MPQNFHKNRGHSIFFFQSLYSSPRTYLQNLYILMIAQKSSVSTRGDAAMTSPVRVSTRKETAVVTPTPAPKSSSKLHAVSPVSKFKLTEEENAICSKPTLHVKVQSTSSQTQTPDRNVKKKESSKNEKRSKSVDPKVLRSPESPHSMKSSLVISPRTEKVYRLVRKSTGALGGNGYDGAIYGELTMHSMQKIINTMVEKCELTHQSRFIDIGAGLGKPNFHAAQDPAVRLSIGVELEEIRWKVKENTIQ